MPTRASILVASLVLPALMAIACGRQELDGLDDGPVVAGSGRGGGAAGAAGSTAGAGGTHAGGAGGSAVPPIADQTPLCTALAAGGDPDSLRVFNWWVARPGCSNDPSCFTEAVIDSDSCVLFVQKTGQPVGGEPTPAQMFNLQPQDCQTARGWATSSQFLNALRSSVGCAGTARREAFSVALEDGASPPFKATDFCPEPSIEAVRVCLGRLITRLTHNPWP